MTREPDLLLTLVVMSPGLVLGLMAVIMLCPKPRRRLSQDEVQRLCRITVERARVG